MIWWYHNTLAWWFPERPMQKLTFVLYSPFPHIYTYTKCRECVLRKDLTGPLASAAGGFVSSMQGKDGQA